MVVVNKRFNAYQDFSRVEVRIGNSRVSSSQGQRKITINTKCGLTSAEKTTYPDQKFYCNPPITGKYMSIQSLTNAGLSMGEVNIYQKGIFLKIHSSKLWFDSISFSNSKKESTSRLPLTLAGLPPPPPTLTMITKVSLQLMEILIGYGIQKYIVPTNGFKWTFQKLSLWDYTTVFILYRNCTWECKKYIYIS